MPKTRPKHALSAWGLTEYFGGLEYTASAGIAQLVEHNLAKVGVAGSSPVSRSRLTKRPGFTGPFLYCRPRPVYNLQPMARWQSGYAAACKAVYLGSIPGLASRYKQQKAGIAPAFFFSVLSSPPATPWGEACRGLFCPNRRPAQYWPSA